jgi:hypothetical protein
MSPSFLSFEEFLVAPLDEITPQAPQTMIFAAGGTRRSAALAGIVPTGSGYAQWAYDQLIACFDLFFQHGVRHIITHAIIPSQYQEITQNYREQLLNWVDWVLAGPQALMGYQRQGWKVRLLGAESLPELAPVAQRLRTSQAPTDAPTLWFTVTPDEAAPWEVLLAAVHRTGATTQAEAIRAQFGEDIPPATLYIGSGKPGVFPAVVPPLLMGKMQCYWTQRPGFILERETIRAILYDYAYTRSTWRADKTGRAEQVLKDRQIWEQAPILGLGMRLGPFWYPEPVSDPRRME